MRINYNEGPTFFKRILVYVMFRN